MKRALSFRRKMAAWLSLMLVLSNTSGLLTIHAETNEPAQQEDTVEVQNGKTSPEIMTGSNSAPEEEILDKGEEGDKSARSVITSGEESEYEMTVSDKGLLSEKGTENNQNDEEATLTARMETGKPAQQEDTVEVQNEETSPEEVIESSDAPEEEILNKDEEGEEVAQQTVATRGDSDYEMTASDEGQKPGKKAVTDNNSVEAASELTEVTAYPAFSGKTTENGIEISVSAAEGIFPAGSDLSVSVVPGSDRSQAEEAVEQKRTPDGEVVSSYTFDIKVVNKDGNEIQPVDGKTVTVSFKTAEVANENLETNVYHLENKNGELDAVRLEVSEEGTTAKVDTDGFSLYTVEFTYQAKAYVLSGGEETSLSAILEAVQLTGEAEAVEVSDPELFSAEKNVNGEWTVVSHQAFTTEEWMKVTIGGIEYTITVTDDPDTEPAGDSAQETLTIAVGETKNIPVNEEKRTSLTCTPEEPALYRFYIVPEVDQSFYAENLVVSDAQNKKALAKSEGAGEVFFSMEAGKTYQIDVVGYGAENVIVGLEKSEDYEGTESFRITKINGQDVSDKYGLYVPAEAGCTYELQAQIPLWQLVSSEKVISEFEITAEGRESVFTEDDSVKVLLGENEFSGITPSYYGGSWSSEYLFELDAEMMKAAFAEDPNQLITVIISGTTPENYSELSEIEGLDGYPAWYDDRYLESESEMMASGYSFTLRYNPLPNENDIYHTVAIVPDKLTLAVVLGGASSDSFRAEEDGIWWNDLPEGMTQSEPVTLSLTGSGSSVSANYGGYSASEEDYLVEGFMEVSNLYNEEHRVVTFISVPVGTYTLSYHDPVSGKTIEKQFTVDQGPQYVSDVNEAGFHLVYDGVEVPWDNYGRLLASVEAYGSSSKLPAYPFGCLYGAAVSLNIEAPVAEAVMKIVRADGTLVDADTAAYGETVKFRTTAHSGASENTASHQFEFIFPDSEFVDNFSGSEEHIKPFEINPDSISVKAVTAGGTEIALTSSNAGGPDTYFIDSSAYEEQGYLNIDLNIGPTEEDVDITIDIPAELTGALSCGGYGNKAEMTYYGSDRQTNDVNVVYTGTFILQKIDQQAKPLAGAKFKLEKVDDPDFNPASVTGLSMHFVPHSVIYGDDDNSLVLVGHEGTVVSADDGLEVDDATGSLSFVGVKEGTYLLLETKAPEGHRALEMPLVIELSANLPETIVTGYEYCRWSVKLNDKPLPELVRYQTGLIDPELPTEAFMDSYIAYSCQSSTIVMRVINVPNNITAEVVWEDEGQEDKRPASVDVQLKQNGTDYGDAVTANADNSWSHTWNSLPSAEDDWTVEQVPFANADEYETTYEPIRYEEEKAVLKVINKIKPYEYAYTETTPVWTKGSGVNADFTVKRSINDHYTFPRFTGILVDGVKVNSSGYTAKAGSVKLSLNSDYMQTLDVGTHTLTTNFTDGSVDVDFEVVDKEKPAYKVTFDSDGGSAISQQTVEDGKPAVSPPDPAKEGYTFDGWYLNGTKYDFSTPVTKDITLKAKWTAVPSDKPSGGSDNTESEAVEPEKQVHKVVFDSDGGSAISQQTVEDGKPAVSPPDPAKEGYTFDGWYLNGTKYDFSTPVTKDITLKAKWTAATFGRPSEKSEVNTESARTVISLPNTGDETNVLLWLLMFLLCSAVGAGSVFVLKGRSKS